MARSVWWSAVATVDPTARGEEGVSDEIWYHRYQVS
jgi:hypothetical protein